MRRLMQTGALALCCLMLYGCPYESQVPIDKPRIPVDERMLGAWLSDDQSYNRYTVSRASEYEYKVLQRATTGNTSRYKAHLTDVRGATFMNLYSDSTGTYYLYRVRINPDGSRMTLMPVTESLPGQFVSSEDLRSYIESHMNLKSFYKEEDREEFYKAD